MIFFVLFLLFLECGCETLGTIGGSVGCNEMTGQCQCKPSTATRTCAECADMYYGFPANAQGVSNDIDGHSGGFNEKYPVSSL